VSTKNSSSHDSEIIPDAADFKFGIVVSEWNHEITNELFKGCKETLLKHSAKDENIFILHVPGSFELPQAGQTLIETKNVHALIALGCIIKGETRHDEFIAQAVANGLMNLNLKFGTPCIFGVLTTENLAQANERAGGKAGNKGIEAANTAIKMVSIIKSFTYKEPAGFRKQQ